MDILCEFETYSAYRFEHLGRHLLEPWELHGIPVHITNNIRVEMHSLQAHARGIVAHILSCYPMVVYEPKEETEWI